MKSYYAVLLDTTSIQQYVFGSSKLKENLGASFIISTIYSEIGEIGSNAKYICSKNGYIGGGNALLFFEEKEAAHSFVQQWTRDLLLKAPGVSTSCAISCNTIKDTDLDTESVFVPFKDGLYKKLEKNKFEYAPVITLPSHGINEDCSRTGYACEVWHKDIDTSEYISSIAKTKLDSVSAAKEKLNNDFKDVLDAKDAKDAKYAFPDDFEDLGSSYGEDSHIAIVHIDGNGAGKKFKECRTLSSLQMLSKNLEKAVRDSFAELLTLSIKKLAEIIKEGINLKKGLVPIRPIILGGDDITFVCDGRLGIYFAEQFINVFEKNSPNQMTACAGVAIIKKKYPFFKGYLLAEQLCANAKENRKTKGEGKGSWIDFQIAYGGISAPIKEIRERKFKSSGRNLLLRPYHIGGDDIYSFEKIIENTKHLLRKDLTGKRILSNSKIKELREALSYGDEVCREFVNHLKSRDIVLPTYTNYNFANSLYQNKITPYFDMIELTELYPKFELLNYEKV